LLKNLFFSKEITKYVTIIKTNFADFEKRERCKSETEKMKQNETLSEIIKSCNGIIYVDNIPSTERLEIISKEVRGKVKEIIVEHLLTNCSSYYPIGLDGVVGRVNRYMDEKEKLEKEIEELKEEKIKEKKEREKLEKKLEEAKEKIEQERKNAEKCIIL
jgi:cell division protein FtsB